MTQTIEKLWSRLHMLFGRGRITFVNDAGSVQMVQVRVNALEVGDSRPRLAEYGFSSHPFPGCDVVFGFVGGERSQGVVFATNDQRYRIHLSEGEVAIYDDMGQKVHLTRAGINVSGAGLPVTIQNTPHVTLDSALVTVTGSLHVNGSVVADGDISDHTNKSMLGMRSAYNGHTHSDPQGGTVGAPSAGM